MAKLSKNKRNTKSRSRKNNKRTLKRTRSKTMKNAKKGISMKKMMGGSLRPRKVYCVSCRKKVKVVDYELKQNSRGAYQLVGTCGNNSHKKDKNGERKVYSFVSAKDV